MVDELLIGGIAWFAMTGWMRGFARSLFDALSWMLSILFVTMTIPLLQDQMMDAGWRSLINDRAALIYPEHKSSIAVFAGSGGLSGRSLFEIGIWCVLILLCTLSLFIGFQMIWRVFNVTYSNRQVTLTNSSRRAGTIVGIALGVFLSIYLFQLLSGLSWAIRIEQIDQSIAGSVILHSIFSLFPW
ncbi:MAG: hypothetical protein JWN30_2740 [Bacilli bacterium]|nr:hypothetical protein [Bacilli bacterium]